jgi:hypothetical protein
MKQEARKKYRTPFSYLKVLPKSGKVIGSRIAFVVKMPSFLFITFVIHGVILLCAWLFLLIEQGANPKVNSYLDALYWSVATSTTVGFGDVVPLTDLGKWLTICVMLFGSLCVVIYTAFFAAAIIEPEITQVERKVLEMEAEVKEFERDMKTGDSHQNEILAQIELLLRKGKGGNL